MMCRLMRFDSGLSGGITLVLFQVSGCRAVNLTAQGARLTAQGKNEVGQPTTRLSSPKSVAAIGGRHSDRPLLPIGCATNKPQIIFKIDMIIYRLPSAFSHLPVFFLAPCALSLGPFPPIPRPIPLNIKIRQPESIDIPTCFLYQFLIQIDLQSWLHTKVIVFSLVIISNSYKNTNNKSYCPKSSFQFC